MFQTEKRSVAREISFVTVECADEEKRKDVYLTCVDFGDDPETFFDKVLSEDFQLMHRTTFSGSIRFDWKCGSRNFSTLTNCLKIVKRDGSLLDTSSGRELTCDFVSRNRVTEFGTFCDIIFRPFEEFFVNFLRIEFGPREQLPFILDTIATLSSVYKLSEKFSFDSSRTRRVDFKVCGEGIYKTCNAKNVAVEFDQVTVSINQNTISFMVDGFLKLFLA